MTTNTPNVVLRGNPNDREINPENLHFVEDFNNSLKIFANNCYEHFEPTTERVVRGGNELQVFNWSHRTYVAE